MKNPTFKELVSRAKLLLRSHDGELTRTLARTEGGFGLGQVPERVKPDATTTMVCGFCSTGCGLKVHLRDGQAVNVSPSRDYPVNVGMACPKGWEALTPLYASDRAVTPLLRDAQGQLSPVDWSSALATFVTRFRSILEQHGPESVAFLSTGQIPTEEMAMLGALAKFGMGMRHGDGNTRQCMATSVVAYKEAFGFDAPPFTYEDFEESDVLVFVGANPCIAHPIMWERVCKNRHAPEIVVIDPRRTETAMAATLHVPLKPKSDLVLMYGVAAQLIEQGLIDREYIAAHTEGFEEFAAQVSKFTPAVVCDSTGLSPDMLMRLVRMIGEGKRVSFWWTMGVNQSHEGVRLAQAIIAIALMTRNIGRPGTGANSITGQCNAMGSRLFSNTTNLLGGRDFTNAEQRAHVADVLGIDGARIPDQPSLAYDQIIAGVKSGKIKGLWIIATNTAHSWIDQADLHETFGKLDFLVVQDMYSTTETAQLAHLVLPAAGWGEKDGTFINSERRLGVIKKVSRAPGQALADFYIFKAIAEAWGCAELFSEWTSPEATFQILKRLSRGQPCDITGIADHAEIDACEGVQWPLPEGAKAKKSEQRRLFEDGKFFRPNGRARFIYQDPSPLPEPTSERFPYMLLTGRGSSAQWHTETRTKKSDVLRKLHPDVPYVEVSPADAETLKLGPNDWVRVRSARGFVDVRAFITPVVQPGQLFMPMHYARTNQLTFPAFDPYSRQPSYKASAVAIERLESRASRPF
ncbi:MAG TPA: nitrate reductase [Polyangiales bacterium]|nr:nitrate reductase [Polyangiales bacterium]